MANDVQNSGLIDLFATHRAGQEAMRAQAARALDIPSSPPPAVAMEAHRSGASLFGATPNRRALRARWLAFGAGALTVAAIAAVLVRSNGETVKASLAAPTPPAVAVVSTPAPAPAPEPVVAAPSVEAKAIVPSASASTDDAKPARKRKGHGKAAPSGPKLIKVHSSGVAPEAHTRK